MLEKPDCGQCRKLKAMKGKQTRCDLCIPHLWPENEIPASVFSLVQSQHIMGFNGPVDMKIDVARAEIARMVTNPEEQDLCLYLVRQAYRDCLERMRAK